MVTRAPGVGEARVYEVSTRWSGPVPTWAAPVAGQRVTARDKRRIRKLEQNRTAVDILQDFEFPTVCSRVRMSPDGEFVIATGTYPPQVRVYDVSQLSLKFQRNLDCEIVEFVSLEEDWKKLAFLCADRTLEIHAQMGSYFKTRVPKFGRDLALHRGSCDLFICGVGEDVYRLNLELGQFLAPLKSRSGLKGGNNKGTVSPVNHLLALGGESGLVEIWDPRRLREGTAVGELDVTKALLDHVHLYEPQVQVTSLSFDPLDGLTLAVGCSSGHSMLFDLRSPRAPFAKDQGFDSPINSIDLTFSRRVVSSDTKSIKVWERKDGQNVTFIEPKANINFTSVVPNSGIIFAACETAKVASYFIPSLGVAPVWCSFLESLTEELEESNQTAGDSGATLYENYKFVTKEELERLQLDNLIGTELLKAYMHGYFINLRLYRKAVDASEPMAYENYRKQRVKEKLEAQRESRIAKVNRKNPKVNAKAAEKMRQASKKSKGKAANAFDDDRFKAIFEREDFAIDEEAERYKQLHASQPSAPRARDDDSDDDTLGYHASTMHPSGSDGSESDSDDDNSRSSSSSGSEADQKITPLRSKTRTTHPIRKAQPKAGTRLHEHKPIISQPARRRALTMREMLASSERSR
mmetsp:Transcript_13197/g.26786  ORF Transcript_13197/g.26786 Transcript_13197/m.26786 type:complete len:636 (-) Transcript_13197:558-2465(-)